MKTVKIILIISFILGVVYFILDSRLFYYGKSDFNIYNALPLNIKPDYRPDFENGFALYDEFGFTIAAKSNTYEFENKDVKIYNVLRYCFDNEKLIAFVEDVESLPYSVVFCHMGVNEIEVEIKNDISDINLKDFKCIEIKDNEKHIKKLELARNYIMFIFIILFLLIIIKMIILKKEKI